MNKRITKAEKMTERIMFRHTKKGRSMLEKSANRLGFKSVGAYVRWLISKDAGVIERIYGAGNKKVDIGVRGE